MSKPAIRVEGLSKRYLIGKRERYRTIRDTITDGLCSVARGVRGKGRRDGADEEASEFWALRDVSFEVQPGEVVGVIGRNGAGKSTLLKILSRVTEPTLGFAEIHGRVGSLLEVGTGFHPELTGRENIYLNGAILGMKRAEISAKFDEILAFAEVERFIDTPVKHYSSGMHLRLAFSVAAHLEPEILLVDEVLAVGDAEFQNKCLGKMGNVAREGRTILFVSHNLTAVRSLCSSALLLSDGRIGLSGDVNHVADHYLRKNNASRLEISWADGNAAPAGRGVRLDRVRVVPHGTAGEITVHTPIDLEFSYWNNEEGQILNVSFFLVNLDGTCVFNVASACQPHPIGLATQTASIPGDLLNEGSYYVRLLLVKDGSRRILECDQVVCFEVREGRREGFWFGHFPGAVHPQLTWHSDISASIEA